MTIKRHGSTEIGCICCGLVEYDGLNNTYDRFTPEGAVRAIAEDGCFDRRAEDRGGYGFCQVVMTQMWPTRNKKNCPNAGNLDKFVAYVKKHKLGTIALGAAKINPNSGNMVRAAVFSPNVGAMAAWMKKNGIATDNPRESGYYW